MSNTINRNGVGSDMTKQEIGLNDLMKFVQQVRESKYGIDALKALQWMVKDAINGNAHFQQLTEMIDE